MSDETALVVVGPPDEKRLELARRRLALSRQRTAEAWKAFRADLSRKADWRTWYRARPGVFLAGAFVVGVLLARRR